MCRLSALAVFTLAVGLARAADPAETITVSASATAYARPDTARVHYVVKMSEPSVEAARDSITKHVGTMGESFKGLKLAGLTTAAGPVTYTRSAAGRVRAGPGGAPAAVAASYTAQVPFTATIREKDPDKLRAAVDAFLAKAVEAGAHITGDGADPDSPFGTARSVAASADAPRVEWALSDDTAARREAIQAAARKARADAEALAKELGWEAVKVISASDGTAAAAPADAADLPVRAARAGVGEVAVTARVTLKCSR